jgi:hypothetical protein
MFCRGLSYRTLREGTPGLADAGSRRWEKGTARPTPAPGECRKIAKPLREVSDSVLDVLSGFVLRQNTITPRRGVERVGVKKTMTPRAFCPTPGRRRLRRLVDLVAARDQLVQLELPAM